MTPPAANPTSATAVLQPSHIRSRPVRLQCDKLRPGSGGTRPEKEDSAMTTRKNTAAAILGICCVLVIGAVFGPRADAQQKRAPAKQAVDAQGAPLFKVDPFWPK